MIASIADVVVALKELLKQYDKETLLKATAMEGLGFSGVGISGTGNAIATDSFRVGLSLSQEQGGRPALALTKAETAQMNDMQAKYLHGDLPEQKMGAFLELMNRAIETHTHRRGAAA